MSHELKRMEKEINNEITEKKNPHACPQKWHHNRLSIDFSRSTCHFHLKDNIKIDTRREENAGMVWEGTAL